MSKLLTAIVAGALAIGAGSAQANTRLIVNCFFPPKHFVCQDILPKWKEAVEEATDKRVRIVFPAKSMSPPPEQLNSVRNGIFDGAVQFNGFIANEVKGPLVAMIPFTGTSNAEASSVALWRTYEAHLAQADEYDGVELLGLFVSPGADFYSMTDTPITSLADATGRKMWALPGVTAGTLKNNGGSVVSGPAVQMTEIIQRGVVDGFVGIPASDTRAFNVAPYAKSVTQTKRKIFAPTFSFFLSSEKWAEITVEDQAAIKAVSGEEFARLAGGVWGGIEAKILDELPGSMEVVEASDEFEAELVAASSGFVDGWKTAVAEKGIDGAAALEFYSGQIDALTSE